LAEIGEEEVFEDAFELAVAGAVTVLVASALGAFVEEPKNMTPPAIIPKRPPTPTIKNHAGRPVLSEDNCVINIE